MFNNYKRFPIFPLQYLLLYLKRNKTSSMSSSSSRTDSTMKNLIDSKQYQKALNLFNQQSEICSNFTINMAIKACTKLGDYKSGINIQHKLSSSSLNDPYIQASLIHFYMQSRQIDNANRLFSTIVNKSNAMYAAMFKGLISNNMPEKVFDLLDEMTIEPDEITLIVLFNACAEVSNDRAMKVGRKLLERIPNIYKNRDVVLNSAMHMLMKFGDVKRAEYVFELIKKKDVVTYGAMIKGYVENQMSDKALDLFELTKLDPDDITYTVVFNACAQLANDRSMKIGNKLLDQMPDKMRNNKVLLTSAIYMLMKFGDIERAEYVFDLIREKGIITYGAMMKGYNVNSEPWKCLKIFEKMKQQNLVPNNIIFNILIGAYAQMGIIARCQFLISQIPLHIQNKQLIQNSLIDMWSKAGSIGKAKDVFKLISNPDAVTYNNMINGFGRNGMGSEAIELYREMPNNLRDDISHICVLNACSHSGLLNEAHIIFNKITMKTERITTVMVDCLSRLFLFDEAQKLIDKYEKSNSPNFVMYMAMLSGARNNRNNIVSTKIYNRMKLLFPNQKDHLLSGAILLSNIYSSMDDHERSKDIRENQIKGSGVKVKPGVTWTDVNGELVKFRAHDHSHPRSQEIYAEVQRFSSELIEQGHHFDASWITRPLNNDETIESVLCGHSEMLALAYNLIQRPIPSFVQMTKNLRICGSCHQTTKLLAKLRKCEIIVRDANRIHHFNMNGQCSCQDHF